MGKEFFNDWDLWQKMTFVLACLMVCTVFVGLVKLQCDRVKAKKYTAVEKGKQPQTPEMLEAQPISEEPKKDDIPFGIRAIESGIEVDGVWISRSNTPATSSRSSMTDLKLPRSYNSSHIELPMPKAVHGSSSRNSLTSSFDRAVSAERVATNDSRPSSPGSRHPMVPSSRYSNPNYQRNSTTLQALEGQDQSSAFRNGQSSASNSGKSSIRTSDETDYLTIHENRPYEAAYINPKSAALAVPADPRTDLNLLQSHRMSHVAETGQLTPRVRKPGNSGEWASMAENIRSPHEIATTNGVDFFMPRQKTPSPPLEPIRDEYTPSASTQYPDGPHYDRTRQAVETYAPQVQEHQYPQAYQPRGPQHEYEQETLQQEAQAAQNEHQSQVLRKVNSGFEILRPGTLGEPPSPEETESAPTEKRKSKRLQKRRASSGASRTSHFIEQV